MNKLECIGHPNLHVSIYGNTTSNLTPETVSCQCQEAFVHCQDLPYLLVGVDLK